MSEFTFADLSRTNKQRAQRWHKEFPYSEDGWIGSDWSNAAAGEMGETCNIVKKMRRIDIGTEGNNTPPRQDLLDALIKEIGDTAVYLDLLAQYYGSDLGECIETAFNQVSEREGFPERLGKSWGETFIELSESEE